MNYSLYFNGGKGTNLRFENMSGWGSVFLFFHLTFLAPAEFVILEIFVAVALILKVLVMLSTFVCGDDAYKAFNRGLDTAFEAFFGFDKVQIDLFNKQKSLIKLTFTDIPLLLV